jgi:LPS-assembly protein
VPIMTEPKSTQHWDETRIRRCIWICLWVSLWLLAVAPRKAESSSALAQNSVGSHSSRESTILPTDIPINISAERLSFNHKDNTYTAKGNVTVGQGNTRLRADSIVYNGNTGGLTASGKVIVRSGSDVIEAEEVTIFLRTATGVLFNGKLFLTRNNVFLEGKKLEKTADSTYHIEDGSFTTCNGANPDWRITGKDLDVTLEGYGRMKHGFFYIKNIPVLYIPWLVYPAKRQRQSGFLMPSLANSTVRGMDMRFPFFVAFSPSVDATLIPRICTKRAAQAGVELRYFPYEDVKGTFYGEYTNDWKYRPETHQRSHRFYVTWRHDQEFPGQVRFKANGSWISDRDYFEYWGTRFDRRLRVRYLESTAILYRQWNNYLFESEARHFDNLDLPDNAITVQNIPTVSGTLFYQQIPYTPLYLASNLAFDHYYSPLRHRQWLGSRVQVNTRLGLPLSLGPYLKMEPSMTYFAKGYMADYYENDKSISSVRSIRTDLYQVNADLFTDLNAVYEGGILGFQKIKHTIRPRFGWTYRPFGRHQRYPYFDETDRFDRISLLTAELRQTFTGRLGPGEYMDFATLSLSQGVDFVNIRQIEDLVHPLLPQNSPWTTTQAELTLKPLSLVDMVAQAEYDPALNRARRYSLNVGLMDHRGDLVRVLHQFTDDERHQDLNRQTNISLQVKLTSSLDCFFENQYTHQFQFSYFTSVGLNFHPQCWNILLRYSEAREQDQLTGKIKEPDQTVFMTLSLYGLGQVYRFSRDWAEILGHPSESPTSTNH